MSRHFDLELQINKTITSEGSAFEATIYFKKAGKEIIQVRCNSIGDAFHVLHKAVEDLKQVPEFAKHSE